MSIVPERVLKGYRPEEWRPAATPEILAARARLLRDIRQYMAGQDILEVETPILGHFGVTDVYLDNLSTRVDRPDQPGSEELYLITSPEYAMKRLLASGCGSIYQITRAFRNNEYGPIHNPEFSILEWYRPGYDLHAMMDDVSGLLSCLGFPEVEKAGYGNLFQKYTGLDPHQEATGELASLARSLGLEDGYENRGMLLDFIFSHEVAPDLGKDIPVLVHDYPVSQAALARLSEDTPALARRFELFINGIEIANGFDELTDVTEQYRRFTLDNQVRTGIGKNPVPIDDYFLAALDHGLPACAGVAVGLDRLLMVQQKLETVHAVITFPRDRA